MLYTNNMFNLGPFYVTLKLTDELLRGAPSRVITVTTEDHVTSTGYINLQDPMLLNSWDATEAYRNSKLASMVVSKELGRRLKGQYQSLTLLDSVSI